MLSVVVWAAQIMLAILFLYAAIPKLTGRGIERWTGFSDLPSGLVKFIGTTELLGAIGLIVPMATAVIPALTPLAAVGLGIITLMASGFHLRADERVNALETILWSAVAAVIAIARWHLVTEEMHIAPAILIAALAVLVPALLINLAVIIRRPVHG
jgi:hypothetical protein